jgi:hypothetical protein
MPSASAEGRCDNDHDNVLDMKAMDLLVPNRTDVRFWPKADMTSGIANIRFGVRGRFRVRKRGAGGS